MNGIEPQGKPRGIPSIKLMQNIQIITCLYSKYSSGE